METIREEGYQVCLSDIIANSQGLDENGKPSAAYILELGTFSVSENEIQLNSSHFLHDPYCQIELLEDTIRLELIFKDPLNLEFGSLDKNIKTYGKRFNEAHSSGLRYFPVFKLSVVPLLFSGQFAIQFSQPLYWCYTERTEKGFSGLRFVFLPDNVRVVETDGYDVKEIMIEEQRRIAEAEDLQYIEEQRRAEEEEYEAARNNKIRELKKRGEW